MTGRLTYISISIKLSNDKKLIKIKSIPDIKCSYINRAFINVFILLVTDVCHVVQSIVYENKELLDNCSFYIT